MSSEIVAVLSGGALRGVMLLGARMITMRRVLLVAMYFAGAISVIAQDFVSYGDCSVLTENEDHTFLCGSLDRDVVLATCGSGRPLLVVGTSDKDRLWLIPVRVTYGPDQSSITQRWAGQFGNAKTKNDNTIKVFLSQFEETMRFTVGDAVADFSSGDAAQAVSDFLKRCGWHVPV